MLITLTVYRGSHKMAGLVLKGVNKVYHSGSLALYNANLHLGDGEFIAVVGGEKSGKSTLLRVIAGLETVDGGKVILDGRDITEAEPKDRDLAMIFNNNTLYPSLNVYDNMAYGLRMRKASQTLVDQRVKSAAEILGLSDLLSRKPKTLTGAQKQKVALARAIVREPKLYLLDDPLSGFDGQLKGEMANIIVNLQARMNGTFIYATKSISDAMSMATRIIVLKDGFTQQIDTPANLYDYPANAYVAFLIGSPTINFFNGCEVIEEDGAVYAQNRDVKIPLSEKVLSRFTAKDEYVGTGKKVIIGVRPEDISAGEGGFTLQGKISEAENIGGCSYINCDLNGKLSVIAMAEGEKDAAASLCINLDRVYIFDDTTRFTLLERDEGYFNSGYADADLKPLPFDEEEGVKKRVSNVFKKDKKKK